MKPFFAVTSVVLLSGCFPYTIGPKEVGVKTNKALLGKRGVQDNIAESGQVVFYNPLVTDWNSFDKNLQILDMTANIGRGDRAGRDDMRFKTIDGNDISLDIIISYRINPQEAPTILKTVAKNDEELKENIVRTIARSKPRDIFGELETEEFYDAAKRAAQADKVKAVMNEILQPYGVIVDRVNTGDYRFNDEYQQAIEEKKVADQQVEKNRSATAAAEEEYKRKVEEAKGEVAQTIAKADGEFAKAKIEADAYFIQQQRLAEAIIAEGEAEAEGILKMNEALAGSGGEAMVKLEIAEALRGKKIMMLPIGGGGLDVRSTDINSLLQLYGLESIAGKK
jgi:regulator of protease activity HflC (stomatin/prohibitin superfamily)